MQIIKDNLPQFQHDFLISWDFNEKDAPCICLSRLRKEGNGVVADVIGQTFAPSGCISLRQVLEAFETREREEAEQRKRLAEGFKATADSFAKFTGPASEAVKTLAKYVDAELERAAKQPHKAKEADT